jgi:hypothetical protein
MVLHVADLDMAVNVTTVARLPAVSRLRPARAISATSRASVQASSTLLCLLADAWELLIELRGKQQGRGWQVLLRLLR